VIYRFGSFSVDTTSFRLLRSETPVALPPKPIELLLYLLDRPSTLVSKEELFKAIWPDVIVTDNALTQAVSDLRQALGDDAARPVYIQTVARRGYRFVAPVEIAADEAQTKMAHRPRETSSLDALRAFSEGRVRLESLDASEIPAAIENFRQAIALDPSYAPPYIGLANAHFWQYETSRYRSDPDIPLLTLAIEEAMCAEQLDNRLGEAHATLAYLLAGAGRSTEARAAAEQAIGLEPNYWAHYFRLGNATWGEDRLRALRTCLDLYADFSFAYFQIAMVHVARNALELAAQALRQGTAVQARHANRRERFPANGLHWMLGLIHLHRGDPATATAEFEAEIEFARQQLYATEFAIAAWNGRGFARLRQDDVTGAAEMFRQALDLYPSQPRARLGLALTFLRLNEGFEAERELGEAREQIEALARAGRETDVAILSAAEHIVRGRAADAIDILRGLLAERPAGSAGWILPIEPLFEPLKRVAGYEDLLAALAGRAT
jgi:DNA-binding winged helix-turn-helix (wHTH) protein/Tfp pilus assembly protein PilF